MKCGEQGTRGFLRGDSRLHREVRDGAIMAPIPFGGRERVCGYGWAGAVASRYLNCQQCSARW
jgi:hypothetical protein